MPSPLPLPFTLSLALTALTALTAQAAPTPKKVLIVVSSQAQAADQAGFDMEEFAQAYGVLHANGLALEVASPRGGAVTAEKFNPEDDAVKALPPAALAQLRATRRTADLRPGEHDAVFIVGGKGAMFDLPKDSALAQYLAAQHLRGAVLAAVCHGPAAFASVTVNGQPLLQGRRVTGFTNEEETVFGKRWAKEYPWWLETKAREQGARWEEAPLMQPKLVVDGRLVTGQNPFSTPQTAEALVRLLGQVPVARTPFREEASMALATRYLAGERDAVSLQLASDGPRHKPDLIAMLGVYQFKAAPDDTARRNALLLMDLAAPHFDHPRLTLTRAEARAALGEKGPARELLAALQARPGLDERTRQDASQLAQSIGAP